ncbi:MAG: hypothetical protein WAM14_17880 [Candidatus Nitrosopolaris sp.]
MLGLNSEIITGIALIFLSLLFLYACQVNSWRGYWGALFNVGVDYVLIALGAGFIAHGVWSKRNLQTMKPEKHYH